MLPGFLRRVCSLTIFSVVAITFLLGGSCHLAVKVDSPRWITGWLYSDKFWKFCYSLVNWIRLVVILVTTHMTDYFLGLFQAWQGAMLSWDPFAARLVLTSWSSSRVTSFTRRKGRTYGDGIIHLGFPFWCDALLFGRLWAFSDTRHVSRDRLNRVAHIVQWLSRCLCGASTG